MLLCTRCGISFEDGNRFCTTCGSALAIDTSSPESSPSKVFILKNGQQYGPYEYLAIEQWLRTGQCSPNDMAWYEGLKDWQPLGTLFSLDNSHKIHSDSIESDQDDLIDTSLLDDPGEKWERATELKNSGQFEQAAKLFKELLKDYDHPDIILLSASQLVSIVPKLADAPLVIGTHVYTEIQKYVQMTVDAYEQSSPETQEDFQSLGGIEPFRELLASFNKTQEGAKSDSNAFREEYQNLLRMYPNQVLQLDSEREIYKLDMNNADMHFLQANELLSFLGKALSEDKQVAIIAAGDSGFLLYTSKRGKKMIKST
jgi:hypothetical protein